jgi:hypothetical protein
LHNTWSWKGIIHLVPLFLHQSSNLDDLITCLSWQGKHWTKFSWFVPEVLWQT